MRILIVEDEARIRAFLARAFEAEGFARRRRRGRRAGARARAGRRLRPGDPRPAAPRARRTERAARAAPAAPRASGPDPVRAQRPARPSCAASSSARSTTWPSRSRSTSCSPARACSCGARASPMTATVIRVGGLALDLAQPPGACRRHRRGPLDREFRLLHFLMAARRRGDQPRAAAVGGVGIRLRPDAPTSSMCACGGCAGGLGPTRRSRPYAMPAIALPPELPRADSGATASSSCGSRSPLANYAAMIAWPSWETIPFHFVWISLTLRLRLPRVADARDADRARVRDGGHRRARSRSTRSTVSSCGASCSRYR